MTEPDQPLGRYGQSAGDGDLHSVALLGLPLRLLAQSRERHEELVREFSLLALSDEPDRAEVPAAFVELVEVLGVRYAATAAEPDRVIEEALAAKQDTVDVSYQVPAAILQTVDELEHWLQVADEFCATEQLLTLPRTPLQVELAHWYLEEFRRQLTGAAPAPWSGPLEEQPA